MVDGHWTGEWLSSQILAMEYMLRLGHSAPASILILLEVRKQFPEAFDRLQIFIDGGFERGSDILKAIALGATAVGIGRPFLYSLVYGQRGVEHLSQSE